MPRFNFPVPGRRRKEDIAIEPSGRLLKAQKILGSSQINVDSSAQHWDARSNSGISISLSETNTDYEPSHGSRLSNLTEGQVVNSQSAGHLPGFDEESGVLPPALIHGDGDSYYGHDGRSITDASSVRRKLSSSTIVSYYDKSKVPLVISQQTSSSAMAKGLPPKASSLLDIDGSLAKASKGKKSKPAKLDLSRMFASRRSSATLATLHAERGLAQGPDITITRSPSSMSSSPLGYLTRPLSRQHGDKKLQPSMRGSQTRGDRRGSASPNHKLPSHRSAIEQDSTRLQSLYQHYEQMTFRTVPAQVEQAATNGSPAPTGEDAATISPMASMNNLADEYQNDSEHYPADQRASYAPAYKNITSYLQECGNGDSAVSMDMSGLPTPQSTNGNCSDSISSRQSRTSRQTTRSLLDVDLQQTSVLSLSSDSEDDEVDIRPKTSAAFVSSLNSAHDTSHNRRPTTSRSFSSGHAKPVHTSAHLDRVSQLLPVPVGHIHGKSRQSAAASRASFLSASSNSTVKQAFQDAQSLSQNSRASVTSTNTVNSIDPANYTVYEARAITLIPAQGASCNPDMHPDFVSCSDQLTPPLSPSSMDFLMRPDREPVLDGSPSSLPSGRSAFEDDSTRGSSSSVQGRFMAVTHQEEMLLAALRNKRLRMRESIIAEFEQEQQKSKATAAVLEPPRSEQHQLTPLSKKRASIDVMLELHAPQPQSVALTSVSFKDFPFHIDDGTCHVPRSASFQNSTQSSSSSSVALSQRTRPSATRALSPNTDFSPRDDFGLTTTYLNMSASRYGSKSGSVCSDISSEKIAIGGRPGNDSSDGVSRSDSSTHLSGCLDFEDRASGTMRTYASSGLQTPVEHSPIGAAATVHDHLPDDLYDSDDDFSIHIVDEPMDLPLGDDLGIDAVEDNEEQGIPRPDSPVNAPLPLPRKRAVRISAVGGGGRIGQEMRWWADDG